ncbi:MucBP domain-containing protein, partial [Aerococcaceae bacterium zg-1292]|nr:MucBP domain-containing protein [Aerococcaceae bacterium zg-1292]
MKNTRKKSFDWYGLKQRFSIRKYHFGAASVLLGTSLILGAGTVHASEQETALGAEQPEVIAPIGAMEDAVDPIEEPIATESEQVIEEVSAPSDGEAELATGEAVNQSEAAEQAETPTAESTAKSEAPETSEENAPETHHSASENVSESTTERIAATTYRYTFFDAETGEEVFRSSAYSVSQLTTSSEPVSFTVDAESEVEALVAESPALQGYQLVQGQLEQFSAVFVEGSSPSKRNFIFQVIKEDKVTGSNGGGARFYSTAADVAALSEELSIPARTPVRNNSALSAAEKEEVKAAVIAANPFINTDTTKAYQDKIEVDEAGGVTVTVYDENDGSLLKSYTLTSDRTVVSRTVFDSSMTLSRTTIGKDGDTNGITISVNLTATAGDVYTMKIPKSSIYSLRDGDIEKLTGIGTTTLTSDDNFYYITNKIETTASVRQNIVLSETNNYKQQMEPMTDLGDIVRTVTLSGHTNDGHNLGSVSKTYTTQIQPSMNPDTSRTTPSTNTARYVAVKTDYTYVVNVNEPNGVKDDGYPSSKINASVNYGTTITVPVPESFTLNEAATMAKNAFGDKTTISQPGGIGSDIIITVPKGSGDQNWEGKPGYQIVGRYDRETPEQDTTVTADRPITIVQKLDDAGTKTLEATTGPWTENLRGKDSIQPTGNLGVGAENALISSTLLLDENTANDPAYVNSFSFSNNSIYSLSDAILTIGVANGLDATGIKVPSTTSELPSTTSYSYTLTYADGTQSSGTVNAGGTIMRTGNSAIRTAEFRPNLIGATEKTEPPKEADNKNGVKNQFEVLGTVSKTYDDGSPVKGGDELTSQITITSPTLNDPQTGKQTFVTAKTTQTVISADDLKAAINGYRYQGSKVPGTPNAGYVSVYNEANPNETTHEMLQPTFYYVLPRHTSYDASTSKFQDNPTVETYTITDSQGFARQVVKVDYSKQTGYYFPTDITANANQVHMTNNNTAVTGNYPMEIYATTSTNMLKTKVSALKDFDSNITQGNVDNTYRIWSSNWTIQQAAALYPAGMSQGNLDEGIFKNIGTSDDKGVTDMAFEFSIVNALSTESTNVQGYINLPRTETGSQYNFYMTGPATTDYKGEHTILYSTSPANLNVTSLSQITNTYVTADKITDWSTVKSLYVLSPKVSSNSSFGRIMIPGENPTVASDANKTAGLSFIVNADGYDKPQVTKETQTTAPKISIIGQSTVKTVLEYEDAAGVIQRVPLAYKKTYNDGRDTMNQADFPSSIDGFGEADKTVINDLLTKGYDLAADFPSTTLENGKVTWQDGEVNNTGVLGQKVQYYFDDDTVVYRLRQVIAEISEPPTPGTSEVPEVETDKGYTYPETTPVEDNLDKEESYYATATAKRKVSYVFDDNGTDKPVVADVEQTVAFKAPKKYHVNLVTGKVVNTIEGDFAPVSSKTTDNKATMGADGIVTTSGTTTIENIATIPAVTGEFDGWYQVSEMNAAETVLNSSDDISGEIVYRRYQKADIQYVFEADNGTETELATATNSGKPEETIDFDYAAKLAEFEGQGYIVKSTDFTDGKEVFDNDSTVDQHYKVVLVKVAIEAPDEISAGVKGQPQTETMTSSVTKELPNLSAVTYSFDDDSQSKTVPGEGSYTLDATSGVITFTPEVDFVGTATPVIVKASATLTKTDGSTEVISDTATYTPTVYAVSPSDDTTTGRKGETQTSISGAERFSDLNTADNTPDGTKPDWSTASFTFEDGKTTAIVEGEGTYTIDPATGTVTFTPEADYVGAASGVNVTVKVTATDAERETHELTATGKYTPTVTDVLGTVVINYVDEEGAPIKDSVTDTPASTTGTPYDTTDNEGKPERITTNDGKTYDIIPDKTVGKETGTVVEGETKVIYVYREVKGKVIVNYEDESGAMLQSPVTDTEETSTGTDYNTTDNKTPRITTPDGKTYDIIPDKTRGNETGKVVPGTTEVTYVYKEVKGKVIVHYIDTEGNTIAADEVDTEETSTGIDYDTAEDHKHLTITKDDVTYELLPAITKGNETGKVVPGTTEVTYIYKKVEEPQVPKTGDVIVHYVDEAGNKIAKDKVDTDDSLVETPYDTTDNRLEIITTEDGKTYKRVPEKTQGAETGTVTEGITEVTYVYKEVKGKVEVHYIDTEGNVLQEPRVDTPETSTGTEYNTGENETEKPQAITKDGVTYELLPALTKGNETGKVVEGTTEVTYVYKKVEPVIKEGTVTV